MHPTCSRFFLKLLGVSLKPRSFFFFSFFWQQQLGVSWHFLKTATYCSGGEQGSRRGRPTAASPRQSELEQEAGACPSFAGGRWGSRQGEAGGAGCTGPGGSGPAQLAARGTDGGTRRRVSAWSRFRGRFCVFASCRPTAGAVDRQVPVIGAPRPRSVHPGRTTGAHSSERCACACVRAQALIRARAWVCARVPVCTCYACVCAGRCPSAFTHTRAHTHPSVCVCVHV